MLCYWYWNNSPLVIHRVNGLIPLSIMFYLTFVLCAFPGPSQLYLCLTPLHVYYVPVIASGSDIFGFFLCFLLNQAAIPLRKREGHSTLGCRCFSKMSIRGQLENNIPLISAIAAISRATHLIWPANTFCCCSMACIHRYNEGKERQTARNIDKGRARLLYRSGLWSHFWLFLSKGPLCMKPGGSSVEKVSNFFTPILFD